MKIETNGGRLKTFKSHCPQGICDEIVEIEEIGYLNGTMHVRCTKCGLVLQNDGLAHI